jgi:hypothetical protein
VAVDPGQSGLDWVIENGEERDAIWERTIQPAEDLSWNDPDDWARMRGSRSRMERVESMVGDMGD